MPKHRVHRTIDHIFLGREFKHVHRWMDEPYRWLGPRHRILRHDPISLLIKYGFTPEFVSGMLHIMADYGDTYIRRKVRKINRR